MRIAATVDKATGVVTPLLAADEVLVLDTVSGVVERHPSPALTAEAHKKIAVIRFLLEQGAEAVCAVPGSFCPHSYTVATRSGLQFIGMNPDTPFSLVQAHPQEAIAAAGSGLPENWVGMHGHSCEHPGHGHHHGEHEPGNSGGT